MLDDLLALFAIAPALRPRRDDGGSNAHRDHDARARSAWSACLREARPDVVLVHGDTTTSTAAALAAFYARIPVGHVEAGLRTSDRWMPYPEEMNRRLTAADRLLPFCADGPRARAPAAGNVDAQRRDRHRQHRDRRFLAKPRRVPICRRRRSGARSSRDVRRSSSPRTGARITNTCARSALAMREIAALPAAPATLLAGASVAPRRAVSRTRCSTGFPAWCSWSRSTTRRWSPRSRSAFVLTDSGGLARGSAVPGQAGARDARGDRAPRGSRVGHAGAGRPRSRRDRRRRPALARRRSEPTRAMAHAANPYGDGRASERIARWLAARLLGGAYPEPFTA